MRGAAGHPMPVLNQFCHSKCHSGTGKALSPEPGKGPRHAPTQAAPSYSDPLRQAAGEGLASTRTTAPHGAIKQFDRLRPGGVTPNTQASAVCPRAVPSRSSATRNRPSFTAEAGRAPGPPPPGPAETMLTAVLTTDI
jgi:hypothetical protein